MSEWKMTACESCDPDFERLDELTMCIDGWQYGACEYPTCGGVCVSEGRCSCPCHTT